MRCPGSHYMECNPELDVSPIEPLVERACNAVRNGEVNMDRNKEDLTVAGLSKSFMPIDKVAFAAAIRDMSKDRGLESYKDEILAAAGCVEHHYGYSRDQIGVPLVTAIVSGMALTNHLVGDEFDFEDAERWVAFQVGTLKDWLIAKGVKAEDVDLVGRFATGQATAVLRGEFAEPQERSIQ